MLKGIVVNAIMVVLDTSIFLKRRRLNMPRNLRNHFSYIILPDKIVRPEKTSITNVYGSKGTFWCFTIYESGKGNVYFYINSKYKNYIESKSN